MTRQNNAQMGVANRQIWTVTAITDGHVQVADPQFEQASHRNTHRTFLHLAYASTGHGVQGQTATHADLLLSPPTDAAGAYVGLTRGRHTNTVHIVASTTEQAREQ